MRINLKRVDNSGIYALPDKIKAEALQMVLLDGNVSAYMPVKDGTEIDVPLARPESTVTAILREE